MKRLVCILSICIVSVFTAQAGDGSWQVDWSASARMAGSTGQYMPFWARTGENGILPLRSSGLITAGADISYNHSNGLFLKAASNLVKRGDYLGIYDVHRLT